MHANRAIIGQKLLPKNFSICFTECEQLILVRITVKSQVYYDRFEAESRHAIMVDPRAARSYTPPHIAIQDELMSGGFRKKWTKLNARRIIG